MRRARDARLSRPGVRADVTRAITLALQDGNTADAWATCMAALAGDPDDPVLNELAGIAASRLGRTAEAVSHARRSLAARPDHAPTLVLLGRALRAQGLRAEAAIAFDHAVRCAPTLARPAFLLCATLLEDGDPRALSMFDDLRARFPGEAGGWDEIGQVLAGAGEREAALACFARALQAAPDHPRAMRVGLTLKELGRVAEAASAFEQAFALDPRSVRAGFLLGLCLQDAGDAAGAAAAYRAVLALDPRRAEAAVNLGTVLQDAGDLAAAKDAYRQALTARPDTFGRIAQAMTTSRTGELWLDLGQLRRALGG